MAEPDSFAELAKEVGELWAEIAELALRAARSDAAHPQVKASFLISETERLDYMQRVASLASVVPTLTDRLHTFGFTERIRILPRPPASPDLGSLLRLAPAEIEGFLDSQRTIHDHETHAHIAGLPPVWRSAPHCYTQKRSSAPTSTSLANASSWELYSRPLEVSR